MPEAWPGGVHPPRRVTVLRLPSPPSRRPLRDLCARLLAPCTLCPARMPLVERVAALLGFPSRTIRDVQLTSASCLLLTLAFRVIFAPALPFCCQPHACPSTPPRAGAWGRWQEEGRAAGYSHGRPSVDLEPGAQPPPGLPAAGADPCLHRSAPPCPLQAPSGLLDCLAGWWRSRPGCRVRAPHPSPVGWAYRCLPGHCNRNRYPQRRRWQWRGA